MLTEDVTRDVKKKKRTHSVLVSVRGMRSFDLICVFLMYRLFYTSSIKLCYFYLVFALNNLKITILAKFRTPSTTA